MEIGINLPWGDYGKDFGVKPAPGRVDWRTFIPKEAPRLKKYGIKVIRMFILADGQHCEPQPVMSGGSAADPYITQAFRNDFTKLLQTVKKTGMQLLPVFIDHQFCFDPKIDPHTKRVKGGRFDLINDTRLRATLLKNVLMPLVEISNQKDLRSVIYAWELINEPEMCTGLTNQREQDKNVYLTEMQNFLREGCNMILAVPPPESASPPFDVTVGFQRFQTLSDPVWNTDKLGMTRYQFHYYPYDPNAKPNDYLPFAKFWPAASRCFIGEIGTKACPRHPWPELIYEEGVAASQGLYKQGLEYKLEEVDKRGYPMVFLWSMTAHLDNRPPKPKKDWDCDSEWELRTQRATTTYISKTRR